MMADRPNRSSGGARGNKGGSRGGRGAPRGGKGAGKGGRIGGRPRDDDPTKQLARKLQNVLSRLPETQRRVLEWRMGLVDGAPHNLADTARELGISMSEARDIEKRAFEHIREAVPLDQLQKFLKD